MLEEQLAKAYEEMAAAKSKYMFLRKKSEELDWEDFQKRWIGKYFQYEVGGPDLIRYGKVLGLSKEEHCLSVLEIAITPDYDWVELQIMPWDMSHFEYHHAEELTDIKLHTMMNTFKRNLESNLKHLELSLYDDHS